MLGRINPQSLACYHSPDLSASMSEEQSLSYLCAVHYAVVAIWYAWQL
jgi:hypothetical protein